MQDNRAKNNSKLNSAFFPFEGYQMIVVLLLFMMSLNFVNRFFFAAFFAVAVCIIVNHEAVCISKAMIPTLLFALSLCVFSPNAHESILGFIKQFTYPLCTLVGYNLVSSNRLRRAEQQVTCLIVTLASGAYVHYILNMIKNWGGATSRNTIDFWTNTVIAATGQAALACMMVAVAIALIFSDISKRIKIAMIVILLSIVYYNLTIAGRTLFILLAVTFAIGFLSRFITLHNSVKRLKLVTLVLFTAFLATVLWSTNTFEIRTTFENSNFYNRFFTKNSGEDINEDGRLENKLEYIEQMNKYLWGGKNIHAQIGSAHDILLDTYDEAGIFALLTIVVILVDMLKKCFNICRSPHISDSLKIMTACVISVIMLEFMIEPILAGMAWLLASYCVLYGAYSRLNELNKNIQ